MTTIAQLETEIRGYLKDSTANTNATLFQPDEIRGYLNRSINELCFSTAVNYRHYSYTFTSAVSEILFTDITAGVESHLFDFQFILYKPTGQTLYMDLPRATLHDYKNITTGSYPSVCILEDNKIKFNIPTVIGDSISIIGKWQKTQLSSSADTYPLDTACEFASVAYAVAMGMYKKSMIEAGDKWLGFYSDRRQEIQTRTNKHILQTTPSGLTVNKGVSSTLTYNLGVI